MSDTAMEATGRRPGQTEQQRMKALAITISTLFNEWTGAEERFEQAEERLRHFGREWERQHQRAEGEAEKARRARLAIERLNALAAALYADEGRYIQTNETARLIREALSGVPSGGKIQGFESKEIPAPLRTVATCRHEEIETREDQFTRPVKITWRCSECHTAFAPGVQALNVLAEENEALLSRVALLAEQNVRLEKTAHDNAVELDRVDKENRQELDRLRRVRALLGETLQGKDKLAIADQVRLLLMAPYELLDARVELTEPARDAAPYAAGLRTNGEAKKS